MVNLFLAIVSSAFTRWISVTFDRPFKKVQRLLSMSGIVFITLHPLVIALDQMDFSVFIFRRFKPAVLK